MLHKTQMGARAGRPAWHHTIRLPLRAGSRWFIKQVTARAEAQGAERHFSSLPAYTTLCRDSHLWKCWKKASSLHWAYNAQPTPGVEVRFVRIVTCDFARSTTLKNFTKQEAPARNQKQKHTLAPLSAHSACPMQRYRAKAQAAIMQVAQEAQGPGVVGHEK